MLAYVFWHWKRVEVAAGEYQDRQRAFHAALSADPSPEFLGSFSVSISQAPWAAGGGDAYEDWYLVRDFGALGGLKEAAVSADIAAPHDRASAVSTGGTGGLYGLQRGELLRGPRFAHWFAKPDGLPYRELFTRLAPVVDQEHGALWMRQLALGPAREFCLHAEARLSLPEDLRPLVIPLQQVW